MVERIKLDALDLLIIRVLLEHEKSLDRMLGRMEDLADRLEELVERLEAQRETNVG